MNDSTTSTAGGGDQGREPTEEEMRAALEAEMKRIKVDDVVLQTVVSLINLGGRRAGLAPGTEDERDLAQVQTAIDAVRALLPLLERDAELAKELGPIRDALSRLQMAYAQLPGGPAERRRDAEARTRLELHHVVFAQDNIERVQVLGNPAHFHVVALADDDWVKAFLHKFSHGTVRDSY